MENALEEFENLPFIEKIELQKKWNLDSFIAEDKEGKIVSIVINLEMLPKYFASINKKEYWFFPTNDEDYNTFLEWVFKNKYLDYDSFVTLKTRFLEREKKHNFKEKLYSEQIAEYENRINGKVERTNWNWHTNKDFYKFGVSLFEEGYEIDYNKFKSLYYSKWFKNRLLSVPNTFVEILSAFLKGYFDCQFYSFLLEQQKKLLKGEDINKPFEVEEIRKTDNLLLNCELNEIIEDLKKVQSFSRGITPYIALFTYCLNELNKIQPRLITEKDVIDYSNETLKFKGLSFKNLYSRMKNQDHERIKQIELLKEGSIELYEKYCDILKIAYIPPKRNKPL